MNAPLAKVELTGVPETALWNLYQRASAARAGHLDDPRAVEVLVRLDYPFERFDLPYRGLAARLHAQPRACCRTSSGTRCTACSPPGLGCCPARGCCSTR
jgi:hypothetical protein